LRLRPCSESSAPAGETAQCASLIAPYELVAYDAEDAERIKGRSSPDVMSILGITGRAEMIHRDDLVIGARG
jgi:glutamate 5-kinase